MLRSASTVMRARRLFAPASTLARPLCTTRKRPTGSSATTRSTTTIPTSSPPGKAAPPTVAPPPPDASATASSQSQQAATAKQPAKRVDLTDACVTRLRALSAQRGQPVVLRVTVDAGGCSGFQYNFELEDWATLPRSTADLTPESAAAGDGVFVRDETAVIVDALSLEYLNGAKVDYKAELISSSFRVEDNPNSEASCGCGVSFAPKMDD